jgi:hypothetical protein
LRSLPELARRIEDLDAVILQRAAEEKTIAVFPVRAGLIAEPVFLRFLELSSQPRSVESILRRALEPEGSVTERRPWREPSHVQGHAEAAPPDPDSRARYGLREAPAELPEHLMLVARWFYSKPREGEILFRDGEWPYRRILRACSRLLAPPEAPKSDPPAPPLNP